MVVLALIAATAVIGALLAIWQPGNGSRLVRTGNAGTMIGNTGDVLMFISNSSVVMVIHAVFLLVIVVVVLLVLFFLLLMFLLVLLVLMFLLLVFLLIFVSVKTTESMTLKLHEAVSFYGNKQEV
jgi:hypothetical protein